MKVAILSLSKFSLSGEGGPAMAASKFACPACKVVLQLQQVPAPNTRIKCPKCKSVFVVKGVTPTAPVMQAHPAPAAAAAGSYAVGGSSAQMARPHVQPGARGSSAQMRSPSRPAAPPVGSSAKHRAPAVPIPPHAARPTITEAEDEAYDDEYDDRPQRPRKKTKPPVNMGMMLGILGGVVMLIIVIVLVVIFMNMGDGKSRGPSNLTDLKELEERRKQMDPNFKGHDSTAPANRN